MNQAELIEAISTATSISKRDVRNVLNGLDGVVTRGLLKGEEIPLPGIGKLCAITRTARVARNPRTGEEVQVPASHTVKFKVSSGLKSAVK